MFGPPSTSAGGPSGSSQCHAERRMGPMSRLPAVLPETRPHQQPVRDVHCASHGASCLRRPSFLGRGGTSSACEYRARALRGC